MFSMIYKYDVTDILKSNFRLLKFFESVYDASLGRHIIISIEINYQRECEELFIFSHKMFAYEL